MGRTSATFKEPVGTIKMMAGINTLDPIWAKWWFCSGVEKSRVDCAELFALIGTDYGIGDGSTTFNLPNFMGRTPVGHGTGAGLTARNVGDSGGEEAHVLIEDELATHNHDFPVAPGTVGGASRVTHRDMVTATTIQETSPRGTDTEHNNMPPFLAINIMIKILP